MGGLLGVRLWGFFGASVVWVAGAALLTGAAWGGTQGFLAYRLHEAERALDVLLDGRRYRFLSASAVVEAAPAWAEGQGVHTRTEWVRVRVEPEGRVAARLIVEARLLFFSKRRLIEGRATEEREGAYLCTPPNAPWDDLPDPDAAEEAAALAGHPLPPLPGPLVPTLSALEAWSAAERGLARALGRATLESPATPRTGPLPDAKRLRTQLTAAREPLQRVVGRERPEVEAWLGEAGARGLEEAAGAMLHLDVVLSAAEHDAASAETLLPAYVERRRQVRGALESRLEAAGVFVK